jgi:1-acyl-sn-glycerol-3-phosphate acyltransferase
MKKIIQFIFWIFGWKIDKHAPIGIKKCVIVVGPHTSNWDFIIGRMAFINYGVKGRFLIKKQLFFFLLVFYLGLWVDFQLIALKIII